MSLISRKYFLQLFVSGLGMSLFPILSENNPSSKKLVEVSLDDFKDRVGDAFKIQIENGVEKIAYLKEVRTYDNLPGFPQHITNRKAFALKWEIQSVEPIPDGIFVLYHPQHGKMPIYFDKLQFDVDKVSMETIWT